MPKILLNKSNVDLDYPICRPSLDLDFTQEVLDERITFSRGSIGTRVNRNRLIETVPANQPRFDYDPITGECKGLLIEESRQNLFTYSEDFSNAAWIKSQSSIITTSIIAPNGSTAYKLVENTVSGVGHYFTQSSISKASNAVLTLTIFAKAAERQYLGLVINSASTGFGNRYGAEFNLGNGTVSEHDPAQGTYSSGSYSITPYPNGWYRCRITCTTSTDAQSQVRIVTFRDTNQWTSSSAYAGDGTSGIYIWGAQLEAGAFPTSYIPTDGTAGGKPRSADNASMTGTNFSSWYNQNEGTIYVNAIKLNNTADFNRLFSINDGSSSNVLALYASPNRWDGVRSRGTAQQFFTGVTVSSLSNSNKVTLSFNQSSITPCSNGVLGNTVRTFGSFTPNRLLFGQDWYGGGPNSGTISRLTYYPRALKPNQLQLLTQ